MSYIHQFAVSAACLDDAIGPMRRSSPFSVERPPNDWSACLVSDYYWSPRTAAAATVRVASCVGERPVRLANDASWHRAIPRRGASASCSCAERGCGSNRVPRSGAYNLAPPRTRRNSFVWGFGYKDWSYYCWWLDRPNCSALVFSVWICLAQTKVECWSAHHCRPKGCCSFSSSRYLPAVPTTRPIACECTSGLFFWKWCTRGFRQDRTFVCCRTWVSSW
mmetsp:Transcript_21195/g.58666  ORF Transcript_21195/g.58666 Transcript_21195/m.58666 type:complete len:221 (-) Transcript_21195:286-948(-)